MLHELKITKNYADAVYNGEKTFEFRKNDRGFKVGDQIRFTAYDFSPREKIHKIDHPINFALYDIIYILDNKKGFWEFSDDYVILAIKESTL